MAKVLIVDDALFMRASLKQIYKSINFEVYEAGSGEEAIDIYKKMSPDLVSMDITMPGMDGIDAVKKIIAHDPDARIVMCSVVGLEEKVANAITAGAKDFIIKPFSVDKIKATAYKYKK